MNGERGQIMLLAVIVLSTGMLSAIVIGGTVTLYQLRSAIDVRDSTIASYAADAGLECEMYKQFSDLGFQCQFSPGITTGSDSDGQYWQLHNGARFRIVYIFDPESGFNMIKSVGEFNRATRAFEVFFIESLPEPSP